MKFKHIKTIILVVISTLLFSCQEPKLISGKIMSLSDAYNQDFLTTDHLNDIANYYNYEIVPENFVKYNPELEIPIKKAAIEWYVENTNIGPYITIDLMCITRYFGTYNNVIVIIVRHMQFEIRQSLNEIEMINNIPFYHNTDLLRPLAWRPF
ncbi:MAG TPA: hypothetical protein VFD05_02240 [Bacilli bacterium]|nr:hypothetical protein [Bacilli bacterium]